MAVTSKLRHVVESQQFSRSLLEELFARAEEIKREPHRFMGRLAGSVQEFKPFAETLHLGFWKTRIDQDLLGHYCSFLGKSGAATITQIR